MPFTSLRDPFSAVDYSQGVRGCNTSGPSSFFHAFLSAPTLTNMKLSHERKVSDSCYFHSRHRHLVFIRSVLSELAKIFFDASCT